MSEQGLWLVRAFRWSAIVLGVPSLLGTLGFGGLSLLMWWQRPVVGESSAKVSDSLVNVVVVMAEWVGKGLGFLQGIAEALVRFATVVSAGGLLFAGLLYLTSRGLAGNALWARGVAGLLMLVLLVVGGLASLTGDSGMFRLAGLGVAVLAGYSLWVIWRLTL